MISFHQSMGDHCIILIKVSTQSIISNNRFKVAQPQACQLSTANCKAFRKYNDMLEDKLEEHKLKSCLERLAGLCVQYPVVEDRQREMETLYQ